MKKNVLLLLVVIAVLTLIVVYTKYQHVSFASRNITDVTETNLLEEYTPSDTDSFENTSLFLKNISTDRTEDMKVQTPKTIPHPIRGIYISASAMNSPKARQRILEILDSTTINAVVIDIKDSSGYVFLPEQDGMQGMYTFNRTPYTTQAQAFIHTLKEKDIYLIARIVVFQDPVMATHKPEFALKNKAGFVWKDKKGMAFLDPQNKLVWEYIRDLSLETIQFGFDEINFDYIRYPSDGMISEIAYNIPQDLRRRDMIENFFKYVHEELKIKNGILLSADIFGDTVRLPGDPGIGQTFEQTLPYFDAVAPMTYPSHFASGSYTIQNPDAFPKQIMQGVAIDMQRRLAVWCENTSEQDKEEVCTSFKNRPWIQDFSLHHEYGVNEVKAQIDALEKEGITSWLVWNPASRYTKEAFK